MHTPEPVRWSSVTAGYTATYRSILSLGVHAGPTLTPAELRGVAGAGWTTGFEFGGSVGVGYYLAPEWWMGAYLRAGAFAAGFDYRSFGDSPDGPFRIAGPTRRAELRQRTTEFGGVVKWHPPGRGLALELGGGLAQQNRGVFAPTDLLPGYTADLFDVERRAQNAFHASLSLRARLGVGYVF